MARTLVLKINKHVTYFDVSTPTRARAATVIATGSVNGGVILRVSQRTNGELPWNASTNTTVVVGDATTGILREPFNHSATKANTWQIY